MVKGLQYFEKNGIRIFTSLRCGHRTLKNSKDLNGLNYFITKPIDVEFFETHTIFPYDGETYFVIRDPFEHLISALTFTMSTWNDESLNSNGFFHQLPDEKKLNHCINEIYFEKFNFHWVNRRYQTIYKEILKIDLQKYKYNFILLKNLSEFLKSKFNIDFTDDLSEYNTPYYNKNDIKELIKKNKFENIDRLVEMCFLERYYYILLKDNNFSQKLCHDNILT